VLLRTKWKVSPAAASLPSAPRLPALTKRCAFLLAAFRQSTTSFLTNLTDTVTNTTSSLFGSASSTASDLYSTLSSSFAQAKDGIDGVSSSIELPELPNLSGIQAPEWLRSSWQWFNEGSIGGSEGESESSSRSAQQQPQEQSEGDPQGDGEGGGASAPAVVSALATLSAGREDEDVKVVKEDSNLLQLTKKLIEIRQVLLSIDQSDALKLPSIVVVGSQSSGKSSVLEAVVGHEFLPK
jgi:hypothetical protein